MTRDPLAELNSEPYSYVEDDPLDMVDPSGMLLEPPTPDEASFYGPQAINASTLRWEFYFGWYNPISTASWQELHIPFSLIKRGMRLGIPTLGVDTQWRIHGAEEYALLGNGAACWRGVYTLEVRFKQTLGILGVGLHYWEPWQATDSWTADYSYRPDVNPAS